MPLFGWEMYNIIEKLSRKALYFAIYLQISGIKAVV